MIFNWNLQSVGTSSVHPFVVEYLSKECDNLNQVASDNDDDKDDDDDDDDSNSNDVEVVEIGIDEALTMPGRLVNLKYLSKEERNSLGAMKDNLEKVRVLNKKQSHISDYFMSE